MSAFLTPAQKAADRIEAYYDENSWDKADAPSLSVMEPIIEAAIDEVAGPLVTALREARRGLRMYARGFPADRGLALAMQIDRALARFEQPKGGGG